MATLIRLKRKKSSGNTGIILAAGEAYYNTADKHLYIGNTDGEDATKKKHIAQITPIDAGATTVKFQLGEDVDNIYEKKITAEAIEGTIENAKDAQNVTTSIAGASIDSLFNMKSGKPTSVKSATNATSATTATNYYKDGKQTSIASSFEKVEGDIDKVEEALSTSTTTLQANIDTLSETVSSNKTTTDAVIEKIVDGTTPVEKAINATTATTAKDVSNLSLNSSSEATIRLTWGANHEHSTSFTVSGESIGGTVTSAENVTKSINGVKITDIFETDGAVVKKASQLNNAKSLTTKLDSTTAGSFDGSKDVTIGITGTLPLANGGTGSTTATGALSNLGITVGAEKVNLLADATGNIQGQLNGKQATITGAATSITSKDLTANKVLISNGNKKVDVSSITSTQLSSLSGIKTEVTIQNQLDGKAATNHGEHIPKPETADSSKFLRNDNQWYTVTPANIGAADRVHNHDDTYSKLGHTHDWSHNHDDVYSKLGHTHKYAGSSTVGGSATSAVKLDTDTAGDSNTPVYFSGGKPTACTSLDLDTSGNSATTTKLKTARTIALKGDVTGSVSFDGSANVEITTDVAALEWKSFN